MMMMKNSSIRAATGLAILTLAASLCLLVQGKAVVSRIQINKVRRPEALLVDPMLAIANEAAQYVTMEQAGQSYQHQQPAVHQVQYIVTQQHPGAEQQVQYQQVEVAGQQYQPSGAQEVHHVYHPQPEGEPSHEGGCDHKHSHEYMSFTSLSQEAGQSAQETGGSAQEVGAQENPEARRVEYPGEIVYIGQNSEASKATVEIPAEQQQPQQQQQYQQQNNNLGQTTSELSTIAGMISKSSGMPATILTEIPIRDMPEDVLEQLKRDYGVKVVATRERPGANLVINCGDYSSQESSICAKPPQSSSPYGGGSPYGVPLSYEPQPSSGAEPSSESTPEGGEHSSYGPAQPESAGPSHADGDESSPPSADQPEGHHHHHHHHQQDSHGSNNGEQASPNNEAEARGDSNEQPPESGRYESADRPAAQPENDPQESGFDAPAGVEEGPRH